MEIYQLKTFVTVARERSITRASERLFLSQPAVSAHIKAMEDELDLVLFERTPKGMTLTSDGEQLLSKAEEILGTHRKFLDEAKRIRGSLTGKLALGTIRSADSNVIGQLLARLSEMYPELDVGLQSSTSADVVRNIHNGSLDAGFVVGIDTQDDMLTLVEIRRFGIYLAVPPQMAHQNSPLTWERLAALPWVCPVSSTCCGRVAEWVFETHGFRPRTIINVDQESITRTLIAGGVGVGLLHEGNALDAQHRGEVVLLPEPLQQVKLQFGYLSTRANDPILNAVVGVLRGILEPGDPLALE